MPTAIDFELGEAGVIALRMESDRLPILDNQLGREITNFYGLKGTGTLSVFIEAKQSGQLSALTA